MAELKKTSKFESWIYNMMLTAYLRDNPNEYIKQEAQRVQRRWGKTISKRERIHLANLINAKRDRGELFRVTHDYFSKLEADNKGQNR